jgi:centromere/kinetochore protein ZW10
LLDEKMTLEDAAIGLKAYKEVDERMEQLWHNLDAAVVSPRMDATRSNVPGIKVEGEVLELAGSADGSAESLLSDLEQILTFVAQKLPADLLEPLANVMMGDIISKLTREWLNPAVPSGLKDLDKFHALVSKMKDFCETLQHSGFTGLEQIQDWATKAPTIWLEKCRETSLDSVRVNLAGGIGQSKRVEKIERHMVSIAEGKELSRTGAGAVADTNDWGEGWGEAWDDDKAEDKNEPAPQANDQKEVPGGDDDDAGDAWGWDDNEDTNKDANEKQEEKPVEKETAEAVDGDDGADAWGWGDNDDANGNANQTVETKKDAEAPDEDDGADAWGWGDDGDGPAPAPTSAAQKRRPSKAKDETRELIFKETYSISSMPEPVLELIFSILEDGAALTRDANEYSLLTATAPGLFSLPTFVLALFRAISPHYYSSDAGGNM